MDDSPDHRHRHYPLPFHQRRIWKVCDNNLRNHKFKIFFLVLVLTYAFGYFTALHSLAKQNNTTPKVPSTLIKTVYKCPQATISLPPPSPPPPPPPPPSPPPPSPPPPPPSLSATTLPLPVLSILHKDNQHNSFAQVCANPIKPEFVRSKILQGLYDGVSPYENFPPAHIAGLLKSQSIKGWGSNGEVFERLVKKVRPRIIIEIGTFLGASATHMAKLTRDLGLDTQILCVDDFRGWPGFRDKFSFLAMENGNVMLMAQFLQNVMSLNSSEVILPIPFSTNTALGKLCEWGVMGDLIEVDAGHDFHSAWLDINLAHKLLSPGGVMFGHDYFNGFDKRGVRRAVDLFAKVHGYRVKVDGQHWVLE